MTADRRRRHSRHHSNHVALSRSCSRVLVESLESRQLLTGYTVDGVLPVPSDGPSVLVSETHVSPVSAQDAVAGPKPVISGDPDGNNPVVINSGNTTTAVADGTDFGIIDYTAEVSHTFTIHNDGDEPLLLTGTPRVVISGTNAGDFIVDTQPNDGTGIDPGNSVTFVIRFNPTARGVRTAIATIETNDPSGTAYTFALSGTAIDLSIPSRMRVTQGDNVVPVGTATPVNFGSLPKGTTTPKTLTFTVMNVGAQAITLDPVTLSAQSGFAIESQVDPDHPTQAVIVDPGHTATFMIRMLADTAGVPLATVTLSNAVGGDTQTATFDVTGTVTVPQITVLVGDQAVTQGQSVDFGSVVKGGTAVSKTFTVRNDGPAPLTLGTPTLPDGYALIGTVATTVQPDQSITFTVHLDSSTATGAKNGTLSLVTNDPAANPFTLNLSGSVLANGPKAVMLVDGTAVGGQAVSFGTVSQGKGVAATRTITIRNDGNMTLMLGDITLPPGYTVAEGLGATSLEPGASTTFTVAFTPRVAGVQAGLLTIATNEGGRNAVSAGLTATVTAADKSALGVGSVALSRLPSIILAGTKSAKGTATVTLNNYSADKISGSYTITLYAADGAFARPGIDKVLGTLTAKVNLKARAKSSYAVKIVFPAPPSDGAYNVVAVVTGPDADPAHNFNRAPYAVRIEEAQAKIGATPGDGAAPVTSSLGKKVTQAITLNNTGNLFLSGTATGILYLSKDGTLDDAVKLKSLGGLRLGIAPKKGQRVNFSFTLPKTAPSGFGATGTYRLVVKLTKITSSTPNTLTNDGIVAAGKITLK